jgi:hypothetical protein
MGSGCLPARCCIGAARGARGVGEASGGRREEGRSGRWRRGEEAQRAHAVVGRSGEEASGGSWRVRRDRRGGEGSLGEGSSVRAFPPSLATHHHRFAGSDRVRKMPRGPWTCYLMATAYGRFMKSSICSLASGNFILNIYKNPHGRNVLLSPMQIRIR